MSKRLGGLINPPNLLRYWFPRCRPVAPARRQPNAPPTTTIKINTVPAASPRGTIGAAEPSLPTLNPTSRSAVSRPS